MRPILGLFFYFYVMSTIQLVRFLTGFMIVQCQVSFGQQLIDKLFVGKIQEPTYKFGKGPLILLDEAHHNGIQMNTGFKILGDALIKDGFRINTINDSISNDILQDAEILVIIDALAEQNVNHWELPTPSPFSENEMDIIKNWVLNGGSLLLVADHMPFAGASSKLAKHFDVDFINGFVIDTLEWDTNKFEMKNHSLRKHPITKGNNIKEEINEISTYFGQGFSASNKTYSPIMVFKGEDIVSYQPKTAWQFNEDTLVMPVNGLFQGLAGSFGYGRIVILGDSSLMSAYLIGKNSRPIGINSVETKDNFQFVLNIFHWLSHALN